MGAIPEPIARAEIPISPETIVKIPLVEAAIRATPGIKNWEDGF